MINSSPINKEFLVFQHTSWEGPGHYLLKSAKKLGIKLKIVKIWKEPIPPMNSYTGLIVLGGSINIQNEEYHPFLKTEKQVVKEWISEDRPYFGICLGQQILADVLGAKVGNNYCASIGFIDGHLTRKGKIHPLFRNLPHRIPLFKWHNQTVMEPVPRNIAILATSIECQIEAISIKERPHIVGIQFDNHSADKSGVKKFLQKDQKWIAGLTGKYINPAAIIAEADNYKQTIEKQFDKLFRNFIKLTQIAPPIP